jgi:hypothetical protein
MPFWGGLESKMISMIRQETLGMNGVADDIQNYNHMKEKTASPPNEDSHAEKNAQGGTGCTKVAETVGLPGCATQGAESSTVDDFDAKGFVMSSQDWVDTNKSTFSSFGDELKWLADKKGRWLSVRRIENWASIAAIFGFSFRHTKCGLVWKGGFIGVAQDLTLTRCHAELEQLWKLCQRLLARRIRLKKPLSLICHELDVLRESESKLCEDAVIALKKASPSFRAAVEERHNLDEAKDSAAFRSADRIAPALSLADLITRFDEEGGNLPPAPVRSLLFEKIRQAWPMYQQTVTMESHRSSGEFHPCPVIAALASVRISPSRCVALAGKEVLPSKAP